jgi:MOSC N-terminal beta barrel domain
MSFKTSEQPLNSCYPEQRDALRQLSNAAPSPLILPGLYGELSQKSSLTAAMEELARGLWILLSAWPSRTGRIRSGDRLWMVVDAAFRFLSQRELSHMALIEARNVATGITLTAPGMESISIPFPGPDAEPLDVVVWRDTVRAVAAGAAADVRIGAALGLACRLVYLADTTGRKIDPQFTSGNP